MAYLIVPSPKKSKDLLEMFPRAVPVDLSLLATGTKSASSELEFSSEEITQIFQEAEDFQGPWADVEPNDPPGSIPKTTHVTQQYTTPPHIQDEQYEVIITDAETDDQATQATQAKQVDTAHTTSAGTGEDKGTEILPAYTGSFPPLSSTLTVPTEYLQSALLQFQ